MPAVLSYLLFYGRPPFHIKPFIPGKMVRIGGEAFETTVTFCNAVKKINGKEVSFGFYGGEGISVFLPHIFSLSSSPQRRGGHRGMNFTIPPLPLLPVLTAQGNILLSRQYLP